MKISRLVLAWSLATVCASVWAKLPPAPPGPPPDPAAVAAKAEKDKAAAEKAKVLQAASEDKAVKSFQANMKKAGKPVPKPTPIAVAVAPSPVTPAKGAAPAKDAQPAKK